MHNIEVRSKILDREKIIAIVFTHENSNLFALLSTTRIVNLQKCNIPYVDKLHGYNIMIFSTLIRLSYYEVASTFIINKKKNNDLRGLRSLDAWDANPTLFPTTIRHSAKSDVSRAT